MTFWINRKCAIDDFCAIACIQALERRRGACSHQHVRHYLDPMVIGQMARNQDRLVETAAPQAPAMERHGHEQRPGLAGIGHMTRQEMGDQAGHADAAAIFELQHNLPRQIVIDDRRANAIVYRRLGQARSTNHVIASPLRHRTTARSANRIGYKSQLTPACRTKLQIVIDQRPAQRTARRHDRVDAYPGQAPNAIVTISSHATLVVRARAGHKAQMTPPGTQTERRDIFDRHRRELAFERADRTKAGAKDPDPQFLFDHLAAEIIERLGWVNRDFHDVLLLGHAPATLIEPLKAMVVRLVHAAPAAIAGVDLVCEEDLLPLADQCFDLVIGLASFDTVNDLPGALTLIRRVLRPDGLFLGAFPGAGSLPRLKAAMLAADSETGRGASAHIHPQIDVRAAGDLLQRAGFAMPVADGETLTVRYSGLPSLVRDLRAHGWTNCLSDRPGYPGKAGLIAAAAHFAASADPDGKTAEAFNFVHLSGWAPSPDQPKPARRGSANASLADALKPRSDG